MQLAYLTLHSEPIAKCPKSQNPKPTVGDRVSLIARDFARRIRQPLGYQSPAVAGAVQADLERAIDAGELAAADLVKVVGDRQFLDFKELVARCPRRHQKIS